MCSTKGKIISPLAKQCFVTTGICLNLMTHGLALGINSVILSQLKKTQDIPIDDEIGSWISKNLFSLDKRPVNEHVKDKEVVLWTKDNDFREGNVIPGIKNNNSLVDGRNKQLKLYTRPQIKLHTAALFCNKEFISYNKVTTVAIASVISVLIVPLIIDIIGRRTAIIVKSTLTITGFITMALSTNISFLLTSRFTQGLAFGLGVLGPILIGESSSPKYRGSLLATVTLAMLSGVLVAHGLGSFLSWRNVSWVCTIITIVALIIIIYSPESPSFFAAKGRYTECRKAFHWLRGFDEEDELENLIKSDIMSKEGKTINDQSQRILVRLQNKFYFITSTLQKREFYKPIIIMLHLHVINLWSGSVLFDTYNGDICDVIFGKDFDASMVIVSMDSQRILTSVLSIIIIRNIRRKLMLLTVIPLNITSHLLIAGYIYFKECQMLTPNPIIGILLLHFQIFTVAMGNLPLPNIICGEIFSLEYRGLGNMVSSLSFSLYMVIKIKTFPFLSTNIGLHGAFCIYAGIVAYGLFVSMLLLPETKDKTLQEIENNFKGSSAILIDSNEFDVAINLRNGDSKIETVIN